MQIPNCLPWNSRPKSEPPGEIIYTNLAGSFHPDLIRIKHSQNVADEVTRDKGIRGLETLNVAANTTADSIDEMADSIGSERQLIRLAGTELENMEDPSRFAACSRIRWGSSRS